MCLACEAIIITSPMLNLDYDLENNEFHTYFANIAASVLMIGKSALVFKTKGNYQ